MTRFISPYNAVYFQKDKTTMYPSSWQDADDELRLGLGSVTSFGEGLAKSQLDASGIGVRIHDRGVTISNRHLQSERKVMTVPQTQRPSCKVL